MDIDLGDRARDRITGFRGIVVCDSQWLTGCRRFAIETESLVDGKILDPQWFDADRLEVLDKGVVSLGTESAIPIKSPGGPQKDPPPRTNY